MYVGSWKQRWRRMASVCVCAIDIYTYTHTNGHTWLFIHTPISQLWPTRGPRSKDTPLVMSTLSSLVSQRHCPQKQQGSLQKWSVPELEQGEDRMIWNISPHPKGVPRKSGGCAKRTQQPAWWGPPSLCGNLGRIEHVTGVMDYNLLSQVRTQESTVMSTNKWGRKASCSLQQKAGQ